MTKTVLKLHLIFQLYNIRRHIMKYMLIIFDHDIDLGFMQLFIIINQYIQRSYYLICFIKLII